MLISRDHSLLLVIDIQEKLAPAINHGEVAIKNNQRLLEAARLLALPSFISEQYVKGLGPSIAAIKNVAVDAIYFEKLTSPALANPEFLKHLRQKVANRSL